MTPGSRRANVGRRSRAALVAVSALIAACGYPTFEFVPDDADDATAGDGAPVDSAPTIDSTVDVGGDADTTPADSGPIADATDAPADTAPCPIVTGGDACKTIPKFGSIAQVVDGRDDEFCGIPATKLVANAGAKMLPATPPPGIDTVMWTRIAWSPVAIHLHVRVDQAVVVAPLTSEELWSGDGMELFIAGTSALSGDYTPTVQPGAFQIIAVPPSSSGTTAARAAIYTGSDGFQVFLDPGHFAARLTPTGYELEFKIEWADLKATPAAGKAIGFVDAVDVRQGAPSLKLQSFIGFRPVSGSTPCDLPRGPHPSCDDRTWCIPTLE